MAPLSLHQLKGFLTDQIQSLLICLGTRFDWEYETCIRKRSEFEAGGYLILKSPDARQS